MFVVFPLRAYVSAGPPLVSRGGDPASFRSNSKEGPLGSLEGGLSSVAALRDFDGETRRPGETQVSVVCRVVAGGLPILFGRPSGGRARHCGVNMGWDVPSQEGGVLWSNSADPPTLRSLLPDRDPDELLDISHCPPRPGDVIFRVFANLLAGLSAGVVRHSDDASRGCLPPLCREASTTPSYPRPNSFGSAPALLFMRQVEGRMGVREPGPFTILQVHNPRALASIPLSYSGGKARAARV